MYYKIKLSEYIENDISEISNNLYFLSKSKEIAKNYYNLLYAWIYSLNFLPKRYQKYIWKYRSLNIKWYKIFYEVNNSKKEVYIYRVLSQKQDYINYL